MKHYVSKEAACPFYRMEESQKIYCEGIDGACGLHLAFENPEQAKAYRRQFCCQNWEACWIAKMQELRWEDRDDLPGHVGGCGQEDFRFRLCGGIWKYCNGLCESCAKSRSFGAST